MREIKLSGKHAKGRTAIVDDEDYYRISSFNWWMNDKGYAVRSGLKRKGEPDKTIYMHHEIMDSEGKEGLRLDHINRNPLDNRKQNLRYATVSQNNINVGIRADNSSGYKGVQWYKPRRKWLASVSCQGKKIHIGYYENKLDAAKAYNTKVLELFGEFAYLNDVDHSGFVIKPKAKQSSEHKGVSFNRATNKWRAAIRHKGENVFLGGFYNEDDAARMYNFWALDIHGEEAKLNVIKKEAI
ncbi:HNH endonuclease [Priestia megaterium]|uniref:HNH endonuclease n=1 Tax=Priestia megaterium TaxID=1404 RepID=UPI003670B81F